LNKDPILFNKPPFPLTTLLNPLPKLIPLIYHAIGCISGPRYLITLPKANKPKINLGIKGLSLTASYM
jgi:hypothetical protein